jgi:hypothetical protein
MEFDVRPYDLAAGATSWLVLLGVLSLIAIGVSFALAVARNGVSGIAIFGSGLLSYLDDIGSVSPRRVYALTMLTLKEAVRRKALLVFVVFAILLMFAGWFLADTNDRAELQVNVHVTFLLTAIAWLIIPAVIFLSCWALPEDIRIRSLHTVVTKPARRLEIVIGRMLGMGLVSLVVLVVMGVIGGFWITRMIPESSRNQLMCRVPQFGELYFINQEGQPSQTGINVGDTWLYRSHIAGNSRARAVWMFPQVNESTLVKGAPPNAGGDNGESVDGIRLECRFEAFRTVKGSEKSIRQGVQAQYTLTSNPREEAFGMIAQSEALRPLADALRDARFRNASERMTEIASRIRTAPDELRPADYAGLQTGLLYAHAVLTDLKDERMGSVPELFGTAADAGAKLIITLRQNAQSGTSDVPPYGPFADALDAIASGLAENADGLHESLPKLEVPLPSFHISEYHEGAEENVAFVPRKLRFAADYESQGRFLAGIFEAWNAEGKLAQGNELKSTLADDLARDAGISPLNAEHLVTVLGEQVSAGTLKITDGKLVVADNRRWFTFFDDLIRRELLISQDSDGWMIEKDLLADFTRNGILRIEVACLNDQMYLGMARPDLFLRKPDRSFFVGYAKAILNIGLMLLLIVVLGVTVSCIVKGPVALFFTLTFFVVGQFFHEFMMNMLSGQEQGTGMLESAVLIAQHRNPQVGMDVSETTQTVLKGADKGLEGILRGFSNIIPDFSAFNRGAAFVENGFDVPFREAVLPAIAIFVGFLIPCILLAGAMLKFRELEAK